jgi:hypothetical protein
MQKYKKFYWVLILLLFSYVEKSKKVKQLVVVKKYNNNTIRLETVSQFRSIVVTDTLNILNKDSIFTYIFICTGNKYAEPRLIKTKVVEVGDTVHIIK